LIYYNEVTLTNLQILLTGIFTIIGSLITGIFTYKATKNKNPWKRRVPANDKERLQMIIDHDIFTTTRDWIRTRILSLNYVGNSQNEDDSKKRLENVKLLLLVKYTVWFQAFMTLKEKAVYAYHGGKKGEQAKNELLDSQWWINEFLYKNGDMYKKIFIDRGGCDEFLQLFEEKHQANYVRIERKIKKVVNTKMYNNLFQKMYTIFTAFHDALEDTVLDMEELLNLNGRLTNPIKDWNCEETKLDTKTVSFIREIVLEIYKDQ